MARRFPVWARFQLVAHAGARLIENSSGWAATVAPWAQDCGCLAGRFSRVSQRAHAATFIA